MHVLWQKISRFLQESGCGTDLVVWLIFPGRRIEWPLGNDGVEADVAVNNLSDAKVNHTAVQFQNQSQCRADCTGKELNN